MNILFVCTGNTCRSPMAEGFLKKYCPDDGLTVSSAGICVTYGTKVSEFSVKALMSYEIDISSHIPTQITRSMINSTDLVLTMTKSHSDIIKANMPECSDKVYSIGEYVGMDDVPDPYGYDYEQYELCASQIRSAILKLIERIC